jgi:peptide/nickel transport system ATP-binding protein
MRSMNPTAVLSESPLAQTESVLSVRDLRVTLHTDAGRVEVIRGVSLDVRPSEILAVVGESGSGKSVTFLSVLGLLSRIVPCEVTGSVLFQGTNLTALSGEALRSIRGRALSIIFQDPLSALNPVIRIGDQLADVVQAHEPGVSRGQAWQRAIEALELVRIPGAERRALDYPFQFSGGMRQRVLIAMAVVCRPKLLIADEPTTALDVTIQAQILELLDQLRRELSMSVVLITHDLGLVARYADRVAVMYAGRVIEQTDVWTLFRYPAHPYSAGLLEAVPRIGPTEADLASIPGEPPNVQHISAGCEFAPRCIRRSGRMLCVAERPGLIEIRPGHRAACHFFDEAQPRTPSQVSSSISVSEPLAIVPDVEPFVAGADALLRAKMLVKRFPAKRRGSRRTLVHAVENVSFDLKRGETLGVVGESGSGKSTLARLVLRLTDPTAGRITFENQDITNLSHNALRMARSRMQVMFQDSRSAFNPRMTVESIIAEPLVIAGEWDANGRDRVHAIMRRVGLSPDQGSRYPHEFSGGQQQRIGLARALIRHPALLVLDEPTASLDVSIRAQIINLLQDIQQEFGLSYLFIAHDLAVVHHISDRIAVMYLGRIVEIGDADAVCRAPSHPYTRALLRSIPEPDPALRDRSGAEVQGGDPPDPINPPAGCPYHLRCDLAASIGSRAGADVVEVEGRTLPRVCVSNRPPLVPHRSGQWAACHFSKFMAQGEPERW